MVTTIQLSEKTKDQLFEFQSKLQLELGRKVTYDEVIEYLLKAQKSKIGKRKELFEKHFGIWKEDYLKAVELIKEGRNLERS
jgi:predicted nucleotidyltransferase